MRLVSAAWLPSRWLRFSLAASQLAAVYLAVQVVRQIPLTPGGVGLIEASLLAGFVAAGASHAVAAAAVLGYRVVSFWLVLPVGLAAYLRLTRDRKRAGQAIEATPNKWRLSSTSQFD